MGLLLLPSRSRVENHPGTSMGVSNCLQDKQAEKEPNTQSTAAKCRGLFTAAAHRMKVEPREKQNAAFWGRASGKSQL